MILHDSEDVLHPLELRLFNYLLSCKDMIQLSVASIERKWFKLVPHAVLATDYNSTINKEKSAMGAGSAPIAYWFNQDRCHAPRSYLDLLLQYRARIFGDDCTQGLFLRTTLPY